MESACDWKGWGTIILDARSEDHKRSVFNRWDEANRIQKKERDWHKTGHGKQLNYVS